MLRDFSVQLKAIGGTLLMDGERPVTLKVVSINALLSQSEDERSLSGEEKYKRFKLADRINTAERIDVSVEDLTLIKRLIGSIYPPVIVGPAYDALET